MSTHPSLALGASTLALLPALQLDAAIIVNTTPQQFAAVGNHDIDVRSGQGFRLVVGQFSSSVYMQAGVNNGFDAVMRSGGPASLAKLSYGALIGPSGNWWFGGQLTSNFSTHQWEDLTCSAYFAFRMGFGTSGQHMYGWAELIVDDNDPAPRSITLLRYAYNDVINDPITAGQTVALPVTTTHLSASLVAPAHARIAWTTAQEVANRGWHVERSGDGAAWEAVAFVPSAAPGGHSAEVRAYHYDDRDLRGATGAYYRLRQEDLDGGADYSEVLYVAAGGGDAERVALSPNVAHAGASVTVVGLAGAGDQAWTLFDGAGREVAAAAGAEVPTAGLAVGTYYVAVAGRHLRLVVR